MNARLPLAIALTAASLLAAGAAHAADRAPSDAQSKQQSRMARCNQEAAGQKGAERKAFMKQCLSASSAAKEPARRKSAA